MSETGTLQHLVRVAARQASGPFSGAWRVITSPDGTVRATHASGKELVLGVDLFLASTPPNKETGAGQWVGVAEMHEVSFWIFQCPAHPLSIPALVPDWEQSRHLFVQLGNIRPDYPAFLQAERYWHGVRIAPEARAGFIDACVSERSGVQYKIGGRDRVSQTLCEALSDRGFPKNFSCLFVGPGHWRAVGGVGDYTPRFIILSDVGATATALMLLPAYTLVPCPTTSPVRILSLHA